MDKDKKETEQEFRKRMLNEVLSGKKMFYSEKFSFVVPRGMWLEFVDICHKRGLSASAVIRHFLLVYTIACRYSPRAFIELYKLMNSIVDEKLVSYRPYTRRKVDEV